MLLATANATITHLHNMTLDELTTLEKLNNAFYEYAKNPFWKESVQRYKANLLVKNLELQNDLRTGNYKVSKTTDFIINERGKIREIKAPSIRDRVIQKVLCQEILVPQLSVPLIYDNYASLKNKGTSFARKRLDILLRKYINKYGSDGYALQIDIKKCFDSIDHKILKEMIHKRIHEPKEIMELIDYVVDTSSVGDKGLNLGAEAPQIFAIYYLSDLDNYIKSVKGVKYYGRYMDDMIIVSNSKDELQNLLSDIQIQLAKVKLEINDRKTHITTLKHGFTFMQIKYNVINGNVIKRPSRNKITRERRRLKKYKKKFDNGLMSEYDIHNSYMSWRNNVIKEHNHYKKTIQSMDKLYNELFPVKEVYHKLTREELIRESFKDKEALKCLKKTILSY